MSIAATVVSNAVIMPTARDSRMRTIGMDGRSATQQQASGEEGRLKQCTDFHESDSFWVCLMKQ
jgi:hypothetical protein